MKPDLTKKKICFFGHFDFKRSTMKNDEEKTGT